ncbi:MAG: alcohol dehydrogenase catalytic domain-containing protein [Ancalomicrobiaceae bacterium]|nr:alcohol dehydrogenase catalytic domain-containing protein [Ancalomicrobiaceae bacterium]
MKIQVVVLERAGAFNLRGIDVPGTLGPKPYELRIAVKSGGICGSDGHYSNNSRIGDFVVTEPMVLGHAASAAVAAVGDEIAHLTRGDRVAASPGGPDALSLQISEIPVAGTFYHANVGERAIKPPASGSIDPKPPVLPRYLFAGCIEAFESASQQPPSDMKIRFDR